MTTPTLLGRWIDELPTIPRAARAALIAGVHLLLFTAAYVGAWLVRFEFGLPDEHLAAFYAGLPVAVGLQLATFALLGMFQGWWRYVSLYDMVELGRGLAVAGVLWVLADVFIFGPMPPRTVYVLDFLVAFLLIGGARGSLRLLRESVREAQMPSKHTKRLLILGAGDTGETLLREITKNRELNYEPVGLLDDNDYKQGLRIHGVPVLGKIDQTEEVVDDQRVDEIIIAMPSASRGQMRRVIDIAKQADAEVKVLPGVENMLTGEGSMGRLREVSIDDLLGRDPAELDLESIGRFLTGKRVLVTGAGGSIGSELCRQVLRFSPDALVMVDQGETPLFEIHRELRDDHDAKLHPYVVDVRNETRLRGIFEGHRPDVVLHAAAYKHVPLMEQNPSEAVDNNVYGSQILADLAGEFGCADFVLISTDKAVNPTSVMGTTKRVTELYVQSCNERWADTKFCAVRFGNVLGSNGSVVPIFRQQIKDGGPVTVTHPDMTRFFMTIPEASQLVLQAAALGRGGELFILDMGEPVKIADLARDMIRLSGYTEAEIEIEYIGVRPGEKLYEELTLDEERVDKTRHEQIFVGDGTARRFDEEMARQYRRLLEAAHAGDDRKVRRQLKEIVPSYHHPDIDDRIVSLDERARQSASEAEADSRRDAPRQTTPRRSATGTERSAE